MGRRRVGEVDQDRRSGGRGRTTATRHYGVNKWGGWSRSDSASWRKDSTGSDDGKGRNMDRREVTNNIFGGDNVALLDGPSVKDKNEGVLTVVDNEEVIHDGKSMDMDVNLSVVNKGGVKGHTGLAMKGTEEAKKNEGKKYKKVLRDNLQKGKNELNPDAAVGKKHKLSVAVDEERMGKKSRKDEDCMVVVTKETLANTSAGLQEQPRRNQ
jgi:hypothetical protein